MKALLCLLLASAPAAAEATADLGALSQLGAAAGIKELAWPARAAAPPAGNVCDRSLPRDAAVVPDFAAPTWVLIDQGTLEFRYRFYARAGQKRVSAMVVESEFGPGAVETRLSWESGAEVFVFTRGPLAEQRQDPLCIRAVKPGFDLERLYRALEPRLRRP
jgi:hypothetical protein